MSLGVFLKLGLCLSVRAFLGHRAVFFLYVVSKKNSVTLTLNIK